MSAFRKQCNNASCSFCNLDNWLWGRLCKSALPKSSREEIKAWTIFSVAERDRYLRINPMLRNWYLTDLQILEIWDDIVKLESKITPRLQKIETGWWCARRKRLIGHLFYYLSLLLSSSSSFTKPQPMTLAEFTFVHNFRQNITRVAN